MINIEDFQKIDITVGKILSAEPVPESNKLLKLSVDFKEEKPRQIVSGIAKYFPDCAVLVGKKCMFVTNLEPRMIMGLESNGMLFALSDNEGHFSILEPNDQIVEGTKAK